MYTKNTLGCTVPEALCKSKVLPTQTICSHGTLPAKGKDLFQGTSQICLQTECVSRESTRQPCSVTAAEGHFSARPWGQNRGLDQRKLNLVVVNSPVKSS